MDQTVRPTTPSKRKSGLPWTGVAAIAVFAIVAGAVTYIIARPTAPAANAAYANLGHGIDDVQLVSDTGAPVRWGALTGRPRALFFGFTHCPVICPVTVWELNDAMERIGAPARDLQIEFVTLDSARDTPAALHSFFSGFNGNVKAFGGDAAQIDRVARSYEVTYHRAEEQGGDYTIDHTATVFLINASGQVVDVIGFGSPREVTEQRLRALLGAPAH